MRNVPAAIDLGQIVYNGFEFPPAVNTSCNMTPVYDRSDRGLMYVKYQFKVEFIVYGPDVGSLGEDDPTGTWGGPEAGDSFSNETRTAWNTEPENQKYDHPTAGGGGGSIDHQIHFLRRRLSQPGRELQIAGIGLGPDLHINPDVPWPLSPAGALYDVVWGPKPRMINWEPIGAAGAARIIWECEVGLVECEMTTKSDKERIPERFSPHGSYAGGLLPPEVLQVVYNQNWSINTEGQTTKHYEAIIQVRGYINPANFTHLLDNLNADDYRVYFEPPLLPGYRRSRKYRLNDDKTQLSIEIQDEEVDSDWPLPPGVSKIDVDYSISSSLWGSGPTGGPSGFLIWEAGLTGRMKMAKGFHPFWRRIYPYYLSLIILRSRYKPWQGTNDEAEEVLEFAMGGSGANDLKEKGIHVMMIPLEVALDESVFGRDFGFRFRWMLICPEPAKVPTHARYGYPPNIDYEKQTEVEPDDFDNFPARSYWDWDSWIKSMIGVGGSSTDDLSWHYRTWFKVPASDDPDDWDNTVEVTVLEDWKGKTAPMGIRGVANAGFEDDDRMEPCMENRDFWYQTASSFMASQGNFAGGASFVTGPNDSPGSRQVIFVGNVELYENNQNINAPPINSNDDPFPLKSSVDGETPDGCNRDLGPVRSGIQGDEIVDPSSLQGGYLGDVASLYNPPQVEIGPTDVLATKAQSMGPPSYMVNCTGYSITAGTPPNPPRLAKYGTATAVKSGTRASRSSVTQLSHLPEMWMVKWDLWYDLIGSPNGIKRKSGDSSTSLPRDDYASTIYTEENTNFLAVRRLG